MWGPTNQDDEYQCCILAATGTSESAGSSGLCKQNRDGVIAS